MMRITERFGPLLLGALIYAAKEFSLSQDAIFQEREGRLLFPTSSVEPSVAVFFNVYIKTDKALNIVEEQLTQIQNSYLVTRNTSIYFTTLGKDILNQTRINRICTPKDLTCIHQEHLEYGGELDTLQNLYEYCQSQDGHSRVVYLHNKGSYNPSRDQDNWRRALTSAVASADCLKPPDNRCNACGLSFDPPPIQPRMIFTGNFFVARCDYVGRLVPPKEFGEKQELVKHYARSKMRKGRFVANSEQVGIWSWGTGRYAAEHWVSSHPSIVPCDLSAAKEWHHWRKERPGETFQWAIAPRHPFGSFPDNPDFRFRDYFLLPGSLYRWFFLYNQTPPSDSWIWKYYPDGSLWKEMVRTHGPEEAVQVVTDPSFRRDFFESYNVNRSSVLKSLDRIQLLEGTESLGTQQLRAACTETPCQETTLVLFSFC